MSRAFLALVVVSLAAAVAHADLRPPAGMKRVTLDNKITTDKEYPDYLFFTVTGGTGKRAKLTPVKLDPKNPVVLSGAGRGAGIGRQGSFVAVPKDVAKNFESEEKLHATIRDRKVEGMLTAKANLDSQTTIKETDPRTVVVYTFSVEKIDKDGITLKWRGEEASPEKKDDKKKDSAEDENEEAAPGVTAYTPRGGLWVAGLAAALAVMLGGTWLVGRARRKT